MDKLRDDNDLKWKALDILSLKLQRMIAIRWPYDGYLGRIGMSLMVNAQIPFEIYPTEIGHPALKNDRLSPESPFKKAPK